MSDWLTRKTSTWPKSSTFRAQFRLSDGPYEVLSTMGSGRLIFIWSTPYLPSTESFNHLPLYEDGLPTDGFLNKSVQLAQDHTGHDDIDGYHNNIVQDAHRFLTRFGDSTSPHVLTIQKLVLGATGQREHFGAMFRFENHISANTPMFWASAMEYRPVPRSVLVAAEIAPLVIGQWASFRQALIRHHCCRETFTWAFSRTI
jgi:hypothetical protein